MPKKIHDMKGWLLFYRSFTSCLSWTGSPLAMSLSHFFGFFVPLCCPSFLAGTRETATSTAPSADTAGSK